MRGLRIAFCGLIGAAFSSCGPVASQGNFDSPNPAAKMYAIERAAATGDQSAVPSIVEQLDSDDPAVRALAIASLQRLTGQTHGYRDYDPPHIRRAAIERWREAIERGAIDLTAHDHRDGELTSK